MTEIHNEQKTAGVDTNSLSTKTNGLEVGTCDQVTFYVNGVSGTHANHIVTLQYSFEDVDTSYQNSTHAIQGTGALQVTDIKSVQWIRLKVTTIEGGVSTCDLCISPSREKKRFC